ncbi:hypothetical protein M8C21_033903 [Ambrosia artemisiifolia]|uniref:peroxidase n=1 Tax=Ambrosia artemisiifolia TaxID=4212 RepID=A0AAD5CYP6_AMBAR|nr:hypothetical protein M8C21_033903 [Ambrosia artemisiifolia]
MDPHRSLRTIFVFVIILILSLNNIEIKAQLSPTFYDTTCPNALTTIRTSIRTAVSRQRRMAAFLIRLHFHDCFVQVRFICLGRRDSTTANRVLADSLPRADQDLASLIRDFDAKGLNERDMVALSGSHTIGQSRCVAFRARIYGNVTNTDANFASTRRRNCPENRGNGDGNLAPLDLVTPNSFDNNYFRNLVQRRGLLQSDQVLFNGGSTDSIVLEYSNNHRRFASDFAAAMVKMGEIEPRTGANGVIRTTCSVAN